MRVEAIELRVVELPLRFPFETSFGREEVKRAVLVCAQADGLQGWGEAPVMAAPRYNEETVETAWHVLRDFLAPAVLGSQLTHPREVRERLRFVRRHHMAKAGLEAAVWDLFAQREGRSLQDLLGGVRERVEVGVSLGIEPTVSELVRRVEEFVGLGYRRVKVKIRPGWDVGVVREIRRQFPDLALQVDANSAYGLEDAPIFEALDEFGLLLIEQPLGEDDLVDHAKLQARLRTAVCLDESIVHPHDARKAIELGSCRVVNIKPARLGGLAAALDTHDVCASHGIPVWCGGMLETGIGRLANLALASLPNFRLPGDLSASDRYFEEDLIEPPVVLEPDGTVRVPAEAGIAPRVRRDRVDRVTVRKEWIRA
ncbi:MAG: o-succinylbenzoate synthase [Armatimonadota bacterium]|nr:o-succinylbenzoate synthase [Armatimonadota bacterium]MDR7391023.1 o-succinylbenzoate synthase [Armatimonadota bacterium]MDR7432891.1 o-succinylbenzoate synthase [Armatimonadota bacterium]MDR7542594.1 o-succinylbenzoate synthase [Armatimonadota bacterium]MDR7598340.1 o-succinylbenzoate synthase [Armatimonadota bacterium]